MELAAGEALESVPVLPGPGYKIEENRSKHENSSSFPQRDAASKFTSPHAADKKVNRNNL
jgi:hypothetical protein